MKRIAHRGFADEYPENTLSAARQAATQADMIELDLRRCRSGEIVVMHDSFVDAVTETRGSVKALSATALSRLNVCNSGQGVPTLTRVLDVVPPEIGLTLELKEAGIAADVIETLRGINNEVVIASSEVGVLHEARAADPTIPVALVFATDPQQHLSAARELDCTHIQPHWGICIATDLVEQAHKAGITVYAWTIDTRLGLSALTVVGVDGVIMDTPLTGTHRETLGPILGRLTRWIPQDTRRRIAYLLLRFVAYVVAVVLVGGIVFLRRKTSTLVKTTTVGWRRSSPSPLTARIAREIDAVTTVVWEELRVVMIAVALLVVVPFTLV